EDGIRDGHVTGVQTCALPIYRPSRWFVPASGQRRKSAVEWLEYHGNRKRPLQSDLRHRRRRNAQWQGRQRLAVRRRRQRHLRVRSEERRVGKEGRTRW